MNPNVEYGSLYREIAVKLQKYDCILNSRVGKYFGKPMLMRRRMTLVRFKLFCNVISNSVHSEIASCWGYLRIRGCICSRQSTMWSFEFRWACRSSCFDGGRSSLCESRGKSAKFFHLIFRRIGGTFHFLLSQSCKGKFYILWLFLDLRVLCRPHSCCQLLHILWGYFMGFLLL